jgi:hypothetical protein
MLPIISVIVLVLFQAFATYWLWRSEAYLRQEKLAQTRLIWLLPFLGAVWVLVMLSEESRESRSP